MNWELLEEGEIVVRPMGGRVYMYVGRVIRNRPEGMRKGKDRREMIKWRTGSALNGEEGRRETGDYRVVVVAAMGG